MTAIEPPPARLIHCVYYAPGLNPLNGPVSQDVWREVSDIKQADLEVDPDGRWRIRCITNLSTLAGFGIISVDRTYWTPGAVSGYFMWLWWHAIVAPAIGSVG